MYTIVEPPKDFEPLNQRCKELVVEIMERVDLTPETIKLRSSTPLYQPGDAKEYIYVVREGNLAYTYRDRTLFFFQEGDIIGFEREVDVFTPTILSDFATILDRYPVADFLAAVHKDNQTTALWQEFLGRYIAALYVVARSLFKDSEPVLPEVRSYPEGTTIIEQDSMSQDVFTMADGEARIVQDGATVGIVNTDEIFGALAAFSGTPRVASVVATTDCLVLVLPKDSFIELIMSRPTVVKRMLEDMASTMVNANQQLGGLSMKL